MSWGKYVPNVAISEGSRIGKGNISPSSSIALEVLGLAL